MNYDDFRSAHAEAHAALLALGKSVDDGGLEKELTELVKLRVSQINRCAFCIQLHLNIARKLHVDEAKLGLIGAWRDAGIFSDREKAALAWAEQLTHLSQTAPSEDDWDKLRTIFNEHEAALLTITVGAINNWNRIAAALRFEPPVPE